MKSMNRKENKKIAVMTAVIMGFMMFAFMPATSAGVTSFTVMPDTGIAGAVQSYSAYVITDGVTSINITIPAGFIAVTPTGGVEIARVDFYNSSTKAYYGYATITSDNADPTGEVDIYCELGGDKITTPQDVDYTAGETTTFESGFPSDTSSAIIKLPTNTQDGSIKITINCTAFQLDMVVISIGEFVRNPGTAGDYVFYADGKEATVEIEEAVVGYGGGIYRGGYWAIRTEDSPSARIYRFWWGEDTDIPVTGGWFGLPDSIGLYRGGEWILSNSIDDPFRDHTVRWGRATDIPVTGDWSGGTDSIGLYRGGVWILSNSIDTLARDHQIGWGKDTDIPVTGDWNNDGTDTIGLYRGGQWILSNSIDDPSRNYDVRWGKDTDIPVTGDWDNDGTDTIGLYRGGQWILSNSIDDPSRDQDFRWGRAGDIPVSGDWI